MTIWVIRQADFVRILCDVAAHITHDFSKRFAKLCYQDGMMSIEEFAAGLRKRCSGSADITVDKF